MKVYLIFLQTLDGKLALNRGDDLSWGTKRDKLYFKEMSIKIGTMIMGHNTYLTLPKVVFKNRKSFVLTEIEHETQENVEFIVNKTPQDVINILEAKGIKQVAVIGGAYVINEFVKSNLIDEIYITIAPKIFGKGLESFKGDYDMKSLKLLDYEVFEDEVLLHYQVLK